MRLVQNRENSGPFCKEPEAIARWWSWWLQRAHRPVYITHELNKVTEPFLRTQQIDYLIVQDLNEIVRRTTQFMREMPSDDRESYELEGIPFRLLTQFNLR